MDITSQVIQAINGWLQSLASGVLPPALNAAGQLLFQTPEYDSIAEVQQSWGIVRGVADGLFVIAVLGGGLLVMSSGTFDSEYTAKRILPRLVLSTVLSNASLAISSALIRLDNGLVQGILGPDPVGTIWRQLTDGLASPQIAGQVIASLVGLVAAVLAVLLVVVFIARDLLLLVATVIAPLALATYSLPQLEEIAHLWWRAYLALLFVQVVQAVLVEIGVQVFKHTDWLGAPTSGLIAALILVTLLYLLVKLPFAAYRWAFGHSVGQNRIVRTAVVAARAIVAAVA